MPLPLAASARCWYWSWTFLVWFLSTGFWPCCDCCSHWSQLTKYTWSLSVLPVLMQDVLMPTLLSATPSPLRGPACSQMLPRTTPGVFWCSLPHISSLSPHHPAHPHPSEPCSWRPALTTSLLQTASLLRSSPAAGPTWTAHQAWDSGRLWVSSHVSHCWEVPEGDHSPLLQLSRTGPPAGPPHAGLRSPVAGGGLCFCDLLHTLWYSLRFINQLITQF